MNGPLEGCFLPVDQLDPGLPVAGLFILDLDDFGQRVDAGRQAQLFCHQVDGFICECRSGNGEHRGDQSSFREHCTSSRLFELGDTQASARISIQPWRQERTVKGVSNRCENNAKRAVKEMKMPIWCVLKGNKRVSPAI
nr:MULTISPECIES: hypothetical protein [unclassified Mameliella]